MIEQLEVDSRYGECVLDVDTVCYFFNTSYLFTQIIRLMKERGMDEKKGLDLLGCHFAQCATMALESLKDANSTHYVEPALIEKEASVILDIIELRFSEE